MRLRVCLCKNLTAHSFVMSGEGRREGADRGSVRRHFHSKARLEQQQPGSSAAAL